MMVRDKKDIILLIHVCYFIIIELIGFILKKSVMYI